MSVHGQLTNNFHISEFKCNDVFNTPVPSKHVLNCLQLAQNLQVLRTYLNAPIKINSGYRTFAYNKRVGGASGSKHRLSMAADIVVEGYTPKQVHESIEKLILLGKMNKGGLGSYDNFTHYDVFFDGINQRRW